MNLTPIPEKAAADMLGVTLRTIRNAVDRKDLVRIPGTGILQHVAKEQVELFVGKSRITKGQLSPTELKTWYAVAETIATPVAQVQQSEKQASQQKDTGAYSIEETINAFPNVPKEIWAGLAVIGAGAIASQGSGVPQGNPFQKLVPRLAHG
jgi:hypothetical protein